MNKSKGFQKSQLNCERGEYGQSREMSTPPSEVEEFFEKFIKYPTVFRPKEEMMTVMPIGIVATFIAILVVAIIFAMTHHDGSGTTESARFGVLIGIFAVCNVLHNYVNLNIGLKLALGQVAAYFVQWTIIGIVINLIYKPLATP